MRSLLQDYRQQLLEAAEFMRAKGEAIPPNLEEAITHINNTLYHFI
jgi:pyridoxal biosynthesis lyase PdxS